MNSDRVAASSMMRAIGAVALLAVGGVGALALVIDPRVALIGAPLVMALVDEGVVLARARPRAVSPPSGSMRGVAARLAWRVAAAGANAIAARVLALLEATGDVRATAWVVPPIACVVGATWLVAARGASVVEEGNERRWIVAAMIASFDAMVTVAALVLSVATRGMLAAGAMLAVLVIVRGIVIVRWGSAVRRARGAAFVFEGWVVAAAAATWFAAHVAAWTSLAMAAAAVIASFVWEGRREDRDATRAFERSCAALIVATVHALLVAAAPR